MYIETVRNRNSPPAILLREGWREGKKVRKRTLANLSHLPKNIIELIRRALKGEAFVAVSEAFEVIKSSLHGHVNACRTTMRRLRFDKLLASKPCRERNLVEAMVAARILEPDSKLATTRWWHTTTLPESLGVADANEDDLYAAMDWLLERQERIEKKLAGRHLKKGGLVLYDLSSSYFEGVTCPLAAMGYSRDGKRDRLQVNYGLVTDERGCPVAVSVFAGNESDSTTLMRECAILSWKLKRLPTPWFDDVGKNNIKPQEKGAEMGSLLRTAKKHKKSRRLGEPEVMAREEYGELEVDVKIEMIRSLIPLGLMHVHELLDDEVKELAGERYARKDELERGRRHGTNPGTVGLAGQRVPIRVPRVRSQEGVEIPLRSYEALNDGGEVNDLLLKRVLYGISCRNYEAAAEAIPGAIGLSSSTVSRGFVQASAAKLREMQERDLSGEDVVALFLDGKSFADAMMVIALGITLSGKKRFLGFVETNTENEKVLTPFLRSLLARGLDSSQGLLVIIDGGKSLKAAVKKAFRKRVLIQRCQWHKRENVVSYLSKGEQASLRKRLQSAYNRPEYKEALAALDQLHDELEERNQSAAASLEEGIEETLTLHRLGVYGVLGRSFKTTNCLESVNALVEERCAKVDHWKNSSQRQRWLATALVDIEPRLRRVIGYRHLPKLREALKRELKIETKTSTVSKKKAA